MGLGFVTKLPHRLQVDDVIDLQFLLDDPGQSYLCRRALVRQVHNRAIGAEFADLYAYEKELGLYLFAPSVTEVPAGLPPLAAQEQS